MNLRELAASMLHFDRVNYGDDETPRWFIDVSLRVPDGPVVGFGAYDAADTERDERNRRKHLFDLVLLLSQGAAAASFDADLRDEILHEWATDMVRVKPHKDAVIDTGKINLDVSVVVAYREIRWLGIYGHDTPENRASVKNDIAMVVGQVEAILRCGKAWKEQQARPEPDDPFDTAGFGGGGSFRWKKKPDG